MGHIDPDALYSCLLSDVRVDATHDGWNPVPNGAGAPSVNDVSIRQYAQQHLVRSFLKKFEESSADGAKRAVELFLGYNTRCSRWVPPHFVVRERANNADLYEAERLNQMLGEVRNVIHSLLVDNKTGLRFSSQEIFANGDFGPGSSNGVDGQSFVSKMSEPLTCHSYSLIYQYLEDVVDCPNWALCELNKVFDGQQPSVVRGSKVSTVPKDRDIDRTICTEPSLSMYYQRGLGVVLDKLLWRRFCYNPSLQPDLNREMARLGSLNCGPNRERFCTIDLKSASDTISRKLVKWLLPKEAFYWFDLLRCRETRLPNGDFVDLHMISSMGNGYTFSLQTLIFTAVVCAVYRVLQIDVKSPQWRWDGSLRELGNYGVFGDDIVCVGEAYLHICTVLEALGFVVNRTKSFAEGDFRESCGTDWFAGVDVRGVYCRSLETPQDRISLFNRLVEWSVVHATPLPKTLNALWKSVKERDRILVPFSEDDAAGFKVPWRTYQRLSREPTVRDRSDIRPTPKGSRSELLSEVNEGDDLLNDQSGPSQVRRTALTKGKVRKGKWRPIPASMHAQSVAISNTGAVMYTRFEVQAQTKDPLSLTSQPIVILLAASKGVIRGGKVALRSSEPLFLKRTGVVPTWDSFGTRRSKVRYLVDGWQRWSNAVDVLL